MSTEHATFAEIKRFTLALLEEHGAHGWTVVADRAKKRAGQCTRSTRTISFSVLLLAARTRDGSFETARHEVAHALTPGHGHDLTWKRKFIELGGSGRRCYDSETIINPQLIKAPYEAICQLHGVIARYQRAPRGAGHICTKCRTRVIWTKNGMPYVRS